MNLISRGQITSKNLLMVIDEFLQEIYHHIEKCLLPPEILSKLPENTNTSDPENVRRMALYSLSFIGFLRISEALSLTGSDITYDADGLTLNIKKSKTDQTGHGSICYIKKNNHKFDAIYWLAIMEEHGLVKNDILLFPYSRQNYTMTLRTRLLSIGVAANLYSFYSFR